MSPQGLIDKYYPEANELRHILLTHSRSVADKALWIADRHPELSLDKDFLYEAAMLHDIGIFSYRCGRYPLFWRQALYLSRLFGSRPDTRRRLSPPCFGL